MRSVLVLRLAAHIYKWTSTLAYILCIRLGVLFSTEQATHLGSIYIALHVAIVLRKHSASLLTTPQRVPTDYGTPIRSGRIFDLLHLCSVLLVLSSMWLLASSKRRFSLDFHIIWKSVFGELLKSMGKPIGLVRSLFTLQHVFTCWASTVTQKRGYVKLLLVVIRWYCEWLNSIMQESSASGE
jgi:hypothetical protein